MESIYSVLIFLPTFIEYGLGVTLAILAIKCMLKYLRDDRNH